MYYLEDLNDVDIQFAKEKHLEYFKSEIKNNLLKYTQLGHKRIDKLEYLIELVLIGKPNELDRFYQHSNKILARKKTILHKIFNYKKFVAKKSAYNAYDLANNLNIPTCIYCNRMYTKTIISTISSKVYTRPTFDHWFSKSVYPIFALSFYNLIPCCNICNTIKGNKQMDLKKNFHPYHKAEKKLNIKFSFKHKSLNETELKIDHNNNNLNKNYLATFKLEPIFRGHTDDLNDLINIAKFYSPAYLESLKTILNNNNITDELLYRLAFGTYIEEKDHHKRPLSKLKKDLLLKLELIKKTTN